MVLGIPGKISILKYMRQLLNRIWNFEFSKLKPSKVHYGLLFIAVLIIGAGYPLVEVFGGIGNAAGDFNLYKYWQTISSGNYFSFRDKSLADSFPHLWLLLASFCVLMRITVIVRSYFLSNKALGELEFERMFLRGLSSFMVGSGTGLLIILVLALLAQRAGLAIDWTGNPIGYAVNSLSHWVDKHVPSILKLDNYWLALVLTIFLKDLPGYFIHWLSHRSRFFWLVTHRSHHVMEFLYPIANPPAFSFDFLLSIPSGLVAIAVSKLIYTQPLVMEMVLWSTAAYCFEIFNHSIVHYPFCYNNPVIRNFCRFFGGGGVYHLVHHSAYEQDQNVNFGGSPFMFWDRIFGTYRKPYAHTPPVGLTDQPKIKWNPMRIIYGGIAQLWYEWQMNRNWRTRLNILIGDVYYKPPVTKDFLLTGK